MERTHLGDNRSAHRSFRSPDGKRFGLGAGRCFSTTILAIYAKIACFFAGILSEIRKRCQGENADNAAGTEDKRSRRRKRWNEMIEAGCNWNLLRRADTAGVCGNTRSAGTKDRKIGGDHVSARRTIEKSRANAQIAHRSRESAACITAAGPLRRAKRKGASRVDASRGLWTQAASWRVASATGPSVLRLRDGETRQTRSINSRFGAPGRGP